MARTLTCGFAMLLLLGLAVTACAEQQVTLQSGTTLVGNVTMDGEVVLVDVDGAALRVPLTDVATIAASVSNSPSQARQLLIKGLETQLLYPGKQAAIGLLAEAYRLSADDPQVAYWYARSLAEAGHGRGAEAVFQPHRSAITAAYPGAADELAKTIEQRLATEALPADLVRRLDHLTAAAGRISMASPERVAYAAYFRLVDQNDEPIPATAFRVASTGESRNLESFSDGYYLYTFFRRGSTDPNPCRLELTRIGLVGDTFQFHASATEVENAGEFRVKRLTDADRLPVVVWVVDAHGEPLRDVQVAVNVSSSGGGERIPPVRTSADGRAEFKLFPASYACQVVRAGYNPGTQRISVAETASQPTNVKVTLYRTISATVRVVWRSQAVDRPDVPSPSGGVVSTGEFNLYVGNRPAASPRSYAASSMRWIRLSQNEDQLQLQLTSEWRYAWRAPSDAWIGRLKVGLVGPAEAAGESATTTAFDKIELDKLDKIKDQFKLLPNVTYVPGRGGAPPLLAEKGAVYVGQLYSRDLRTGQPALYQFKLMVAETSSL